MIYNKFLYKHHIFKPFVFQKCNLWERHIKNTNNSLKTNKQTKNKNHTNRQNKQTNKQQTSIVVDERPLHNSKKKTSKQIKYFSGFSFVHLFGVTSFRKEAKNTFFFFSFKCKLLLIIYTHSHCMKHPVRVKVPIISTFQMSFIFITFIIYTSVSMSLPIVD